MPFHSGLESLRAQLGILVERVKGFVADKPIGTGAAALGAAALIATPFAISRIKRRKKNGKRRRKTKKTRGRKAKSRGHKRGKRAIVRGRGLGSREIHHGHKGSKLVSFRTKDGKLVRFKVKGTSRRHSRRKK